MCLAESVTAGRKCLLGHIRGTSLIPLMSRFILKATVHSPENITCSWFKLEDIFNYFRVQPDSPFLDSALHFWDFLFLFHSNNFSEHWKVFLGLYWSPNQQIKPFTYLILKNYRKRRLFTKNFPLFYSNLYKSGFF